MRAATILVLAAVLAAPAGCGNDDSRPEQSEAPPRLGSTAEPPSEPTPEQGEELPESPPKPPPAKRMKVPTVRFDGARCKPKTVRVREGRNLRVRNQSETSMRFQIPSIGLDIRVQRGRSMNLFLPPGRSEYVCRSTDASAEGVLDVAGGG